jgi:hypothetical protein
VSARRQGRALDASLWGVAGLVAYFSAGNVTAFATDHGTPLHIAVVLAPMVDVALVAALVADGVLTRHGVRPTGWGTLLRWFAGVATLTLNVWESVARADPAGIVLHAVPPLLLILLAEAAPQYRRQFAALADQSVGQCPPNPTVTSDQRSDLRIDQSRDQRDRLFDQRDRLFDQRDRLFDQRDRLFDQPVTSVDQPVVTVGQPVTSVDQPVGHRDQSLTSARETAREERSGGALHEQAAPLPRPLFTSTDTSAAQPLVKSTLASTSKSGPKSTTKSTRGGRGAGLPKKVKSARELSDEQLAELWRAWALVTERPSARAGAVHFAMDQARAARVRSLAESGSSQSRV